MNKTTEQLLKVVSGFSGKFEGAFNIREDGKCAGRQSSENIKIESQEKEEPVIDLPTTTFLWKITPIFSRLLISLSRIVLGSLNGGMPYLKTPPNSCKASKTSTS